MEAISAMLWRMMLGSVSSSGLSSYEYSASTLRAILFMILGLGAFIIMSSTKFSGNSRNCSSVWPKRASWLFVGSEPNKSSQMTSSNMKRSSS